ncbi:interferon kappa [Balaenoptera ricei]|uniref:Interferon kappa n=1 Tax=Balaenoptera musculus TaxID=9771 RepID=A0A8B8XP46_BALMU|nr:interferon kappa [Balaenoptera musculus]XP_059782345.1 interferon kappa [Balaenoptera ricei]
MSAEPDVIRKCTWPVCLVGLFVTGILSLDCSLLDVHLRRVTWQNLSLLSRMSKSFPIECLRESKAFELPQEILSHTQPLTRDIKEAFYEMSRQAFHIFIQDTFKSTWEEKHLRQVQIGLDQQLQYLEQCLEEEEEENEDMREMAEDEWTQSGAPVPQLSNLELRRYFNRIDRFLKDKKYSHCAWEIVRVEIRRCFYFFHKFTALLRRK